MRVSGDTLVCDFCKTVSVPDGNNEGVSVLGDGPGDACPICNIPLVQAAVDKQPILYCNKCRGMMISMDVFPTLVETLRAQQQCTVVAPPVDPDGLNRQINCPHCHKAMDTHFYAGPGNVIMDSCDGCGLNWLDHGELTRIARAPESGEDEADSDTDSTTISAISRMRDADNEALNPHAYDAAYSDGGNNRANAASYAASSESTYSDSGAGAGPESDRTSTTDDDTDWVDEHEARYENDPAVKARRIEEMVERNIVDVTDRHGSASSAILDILTNLF
jgi:Zn-finger nucleic acid-binding protein